MGDTISQKSQLDFGKEINRSLMMIKHGNKTIEEKDILANKGIHNANSEIGFKKGLLAIQGNKNVLAITGDKTKSTTESNIYYVVLFRKLNPKISNKRFILFGYMARSYLLYLMTQIGSIIRLFWVLNIRTKVKYHSRKSLNIIESFFDKNHFSERPSTEEERSLIPVLNKQSQNSQSNLGLALFDRSEHSRPKMKYHSPWKLKTVIAGHHGWVRCIDFDVSNEFFVTGSTDRTIKFWELATGNLFLLFILQDSKR